jgi:hypothetical protein
MEFSRSIAAIHRTRLMPLSRFALLLELVASSSADENNGLGMPSVI